MKKVIGVLIVLVLVLGSFAMGWVVSKNQAKPADTTVTTTVTTTTTAAVTTATTTTTTTTPAPVPEPARAVRICTGPGMFGAVDQYGQVYLWGSDTHGRAEIPADLPPIVDLAIGYHHVVALDQDGKLHGWGEPLYGEIDFMTSTDSYVSISAQGYQTTAVKADGTVRQWGSVNGMGQEFVPAGLDKVSTIHTGIYVSAAVDEKGAVHAWGLLDGEIPEVTNAVMAVPAGQNVAILDAEGNIHGEIPQQGSPLMYREKPEGLTGITKIAGSLYNLAAIDREGKLHVWGNYLKHEAGCSLVDIPENLPEIADVVLGEYTIAALGEDGMIYQWGGGEPPAELNGFGEEGPVFIAERTWFTEVKTAEEYAKAVESSREIIITGDVIVGENNEPGGISKDQHLIIEEGASLTLQYHYTVPIYGEFTNKGTLIIDSGLGPFFQDPNVELGDLQKDVGTMISCYMQNGTGNLKEAMDKENGLSRYCYTPGSGNGTISICEDMTIPYGKTLSLNIHAQLRVEEGCTLTVEGRVETHKEPDVRGVLVGEVEIYQ